MKLLAKIFGKKQNPDIEIAKLVSDYLISFPQCNKLVLISSKDYIGSHYSCEISIEATELLPWAEHHAKAVWSSDIKLLAARKALPLWLSDADLSNNLPSNLPEILYSVIDPYVLDFVVKGKVKIFCPECKTYVENIEMQKLNEDSLANWSRWTDIWLCSNKHQLYYEEHELHLNLSS